MKAISIFLCFILPHGLFGQTKSLSIPKYSNGEIEFWYKYKASRDSILKLNKLELSKEYFHFRFQSETQAIDLVTDSNLVSKGTILNVGEYVSKNLNETHPKFYKQFLPIDTRIAQQLAHLLDSLNLKNTASEHDIPSWKQMLDGTIYLLEFSNPLNYSFKYYGSPESQSNITEAQKINTLVEFLNTKLKLRYSWLNFIHTLPKGCYHAGSYYATCNSKIKK